MYKIILAGTAIALLRGCDAAGPKPSSVLGTWGGSNAGLIADDTSAHVHIACTFGNVPHGISLDAGGSFDVPGEYVLRAFPIAVGPTLPARYQGIVIGNAMTLRVTVSDTTADTIVRLGPVRLVRGKEPQMQVCPICRRPRG
jgi:hypothetical protein